jgi:hypothetical protein
MYSTINFNSPPLKYDNFNIDGVTPKKVSLYADRGAIVTATIVHSENDHKDVVIKIYRNGVECGKPGFQSTTMEPPIQCQPEKL